MDSGAFWTLSGAFCEFLAAVSRNECLRIWTWWMQHMKHWRNKKDTTANSALNVSYITENSLLQVSQKCPKFHLLILKKPCKTTVLSRFSYFSQIFPQYCRGIQKVFLSFSAFLSFMISLIIRAIPPYTGGREIKVYSTSFMYRETILWF